MTADLYAPDAAHLLGALDAASASPTTRTGLGLLAAAPSRSPTPTGPRSGPQPGCGIRGPGSRDETGPASQGRWLVSLTQWTVANPWPCHWISLMQAEPRYSR